jgi:hypothetical protein
MPVGLVDLFEGSGGGAEALLSHDGPLRRPPHSAHAGRRPPPRVTSQAPSRSCLWHHAGAGVLRYLARGHGQAPLAVEAAGVQLR